MFNVQHKENGESFAARHVKALNVRTNLRDEASILWQLRNVPELIQLQGKLDALCVHSSKMRSLCLMKCPSEMLQNFPYFI